MDRPKLRSLLKGFLFFGLIIFLVLGYSFYRIITKPMLRGTNSSLTLIINRNTSATSFIQLLKSKHLIHSRHLWLYLMRVQGLTNKLKAGVYQIEAGETLQQFLKKVTTGKVMVQSFRIVEGRNLKQIILNLQKSPYLKYKKEDWQAIQNNHESAEGLLLADTYNYNAGSDAKSLLLVAHQKLQEYLLTSWQNRSPGLPYKTPYELLIAASILEKETAKMEEKRIISGIIVNRLNQQMPLQMDATVIYGLGANFNGKLRHVDLSLESPYNSYKHRGLPPTPITMVGKEAIDAAAHPLMTNYLYYVAKGDGSHQFSSSYEEQKQAIARYQRKRDP